MARLVASATFVKLEPYVDPQNARTIALEFISSVTYARGTVIGVVTASGKGKAYASGSSDGSEVPVGVLEYDIVVDASGNITYGPSGATSDLSRGSEKTAPVYWKGAFLESELTGLDSNAVTVLKAREIGVSTRKFLYLA